MSADIIMLILGTLDQKYADLWEMDGAVSYTSRFMNQATLRQVNTTGSETNAIGVYVNSRTRKFQDRKPSLLQITSITIDHDRQRDVTIKYSFVRKLDNAVLQRIDDLHINLPPLVHFVPETKPNERSYDFALIFDEKEKQLLNHYWKFMRELETGKRAPATEAQTHFLEVMAKRASPQTQFEHLWLKYKKNIFWEKKLRKGGVTF